MKQVFRNIGYTQRSVVGGVLRPTYFALTKCPIVIYPATRIKSILLYTCHEVAPQQWYNKTWRHGARCDVTWRDVTSRDTLWRHRTVSQRRAALCWVNSPHLDTGLIWLLTRGFLVTDNKLIEPGNWPRGRSVVADQSPSVLRYEQPIRPRYGKQATNQSV